jgi:hypothetical protein
VTIIAEFHLVLALSGAVTSKRVPTAKSTRYTKESQSQLVAKFHFCLFDIYRNSIFATVARLVVVFGEIGIPSLCFPSQLLQDVRMLLGDVR